MRDPTEINAGELNREIRLRTSTRVENGSGGYVLTPVDTDPFWAKVEPLTGREQLIAMQTGIERPHRFTFRYADAPTISAVTQIVYSDRVFDVKSVVDVEEANVKMVVLATEIETGEEA